MDMEGALSIPISDVASRRHLRSARRHYLVVPRQSLSSYGRQAFAVAGPTAWNSLSDDLRDPTLLLTVSDVCLKLGCFQSTSTHSALEVLYALYEYSPLSLLTFNTYKDVGQ